MALEVPVDRSQQHKAKAACRVKAAAKKPAAAGSVVKRPASSTSRTRKKASVEQEKQANIECDDDAAGTQHYSPADCNKTKQDEEVEIEGPNAKKGRNKKGEAKAKAKAKTTKTKASQQTKGAGKGKGKAKRNGRGKGTAKPHAKQTHEEPVETPPPKRARHSPTSAGSGKKTFARRNQPKQDPSKTFWSCLKDAFQSKIHDWVEKPSTLEDPKLSKR